MRRGSDIEVKTQNHHVLELTGMSVQDYMGDG